MKRTADNAFRKDCISEEHILEVEELRVSYDHHRSGLLAKEGKNNLIKCTISGNLLTINSKSEEGTVKEDIIMEKTGEDMQIGFNSKYLSEALKAIEDEDVMLELKTSVTPCIIKPLEGNGYEYLVLPVRISSN